MIIFTVIIIIITIAIIYEGILLGFRLQCKFISKLLPDHSILSIIVAEINTTMIVVDNDHEGVDDGKNLITISIIIMCHDHRDHHEPGYGPKIMMQIDLKADA